MSGEWVSPWWQAMLLPDKWNVCGIEIRALSNWHRFALDNLQNPYVNGGVHDRDAAASLLLICARNMKEGRELYLRPSVKSKNLAKIHKVIKPLKWDELDNACMDYIKSCLRVPMHGEITAMPGGKSYRLLASPPEFPVILCLCDHYQMTLEQAWNYPYVISRCLYDVYREAEKNEDTLFNEAKQQRTETYRATHGEKN